MERMVGTAGFVRGCLAGSLLVYTASSLVFGLGLVLTGTATIHAGVSPRRAGWRLIAGTALTAVGWFIPGAWIVLKAAGVIFGAGLAWLGYGLGSAAPTGFVASK